MPRSRWKVRKAKAPGIDTENSTAIPAAETAAAAHARRLTAPTSSSTGHTFSIAPKPTSAPITRGWRAPASSAATTTAVTITSYRAYTVGPSSGTPITHTQAPRSDLPERRPAYWRSPNTTRSARKASTKKADA